MARRLAALTVVVAAALALAGGAVAALTLTLGSAPSFNVTLDGTDQTVPFSFALTVSGAGTTGWNVTASETPFTAAGHSLGYATVTGVTIGTCTGKKCVDPSNSVTYPVGLSGTAQKIVNAAANTGTGTDPLTANLTLPVPGNAFAGAYASTLTLTVATGP